MKSWHVKTLLDAYSSSLLVLDSLHLHVSVAHPSASSSGSGSGFSLALAYMNSTFPFTLSFWFIAFAVLSFIIISFIDTLPSKLQKSQYFLQKQLKYELVYFPVSPRVLIGKYETH